MAALRTVQTLVQFKSPKIPEDSQSPLISEIPRRNVGRLPSLGNTDRLTQRLDEVFLALDNIRAEQSREKETQRKIRERDQNAVNAKLVFLGTQLNSLNERVERLETSDVFCRFNELAEDFYGLHPRLKKLEDSDVKIEGVYARLAKVEADVADKSRNEPLMKAYGMINLLNQRCDEADQKSELRKKTLDDVMDALHRKVGDLEANMKKFVRTAEEIKKSVAGFDIEPRMSALNATSDATIKRIDIIEQRLNNATSQNMESKGAVPKNSVPESKETIPKRLDSKASGVSLQIKPVVLSNGETNRCLLQFRDEMKRLMTCTWTEKISADPVLTAEGYITDGPTLEKYYADDSRSPFTSNYVNKTIIRSTMLTDLSKSTIENKDTNDEAALKMFYNNVRRWFLPLLGELECRIYLRTDGSLGGWESKGLWLGESNQFRGMYRLVKANAEFAD